MLVSQTQQNQEIFETLDFNSRVDQPVTEHLSTQDRPDPRGGLLCYGAQTKLEPLLLAHLTLTIVEMD